MCCEFESMLDIRVEGKGGKGSSRGGGSRTDMDHLIDFSIPSLGHLFDHREFTKPV